MFVLATIGFWQLGKTEVAKAFIFRTLVAGALLLAVGLGNQELQALRAISITTIAMMVVILGVDSNANARIESYHQ